MQERRTRCRLGQTWKKIGVKTYLFALVINTVENRLVSRLGETRLLPGLLVAFIAVTETLGTEVEGIAEWLVNACEVVLAGHEDLNIGSVISSI